MNGQDGQKPGFVADVFTSVHEALRHAVDELPSKDQKAGFAAS